MKIPLLSHRGVYSYHTWKTHRVWHPDNESTGIWYSNGYRDLGWGLLSQFPPFRYFPKFSALSKHTLTIKHTVHIWQVSPQLSCGDTCQIWTWFKVSNLLFWETEICRNGEINGRSFSNPHPRQGPEATWMTSRTTVARHNSVATQYRWDYTGVAFLSCKNNSYWIRKI